MNVIYICVCDIFVLLTVNLWKLFQTHTHTHKREAGQKHRTSDESLDLQLQNKSIMCPGRGMSDTRRDICSNLSPNYITALLKNDTSLKQFFCCWFTSANLSLLLTCNPGSLMVLFCLRYFHSSQRGMEIGVSQLHQKLLVYLFYGNCPIVHRR